MKGEKKYIIILSLIFIGFVSFQLWGPKPLNWNPTYLPKDKNPFGNYLLNQVIRDVFPSKSISHSNFTIYELQDSISDQENIISISDKFTPDNETVKVLMDKVHRGAHAFISAGRFSGSFRDTLHLSTKDLMFEQNIDMATIDTSFLKMSHSGRDYYYQKDHISYYFFKDSLLYGYQTLATNAFKKPVTIKIPWGSGYFVLNSTPLAFTNNYMVSEQNHELISSTLSYLPIEKVWWTSYYQVGRLESSTPLRFILKTDALRWAYYLTIIGLLFFIVFEGKRKQRIIPIVSPLANTTMEFVQTIGNLYWQAKDYKAIANKKILYFLDRVRSKYYLMHEPDDRLAQLLAKKTGQRIEETQKLFSLIKVIQSSPTISAQMLSDLSKEMDKYNYKN
ncbi:MAG: hypothetical protein HOP30_17035 [Cyclobacteriaceae bacterium]|nr:hypothetical protein [Cyclobacteriaceae bacterium]